MNLAFFFLVRFRFVTISNEARLPGTCASNLFILFFLLSRWVDIFYHFCLRWRSRGFSVCLSHAQSISSPFFSSLHLIISWIETIFSSFFFLLLFKSNDGFVVSLMCRSRCHVNTDNIKHLNAALYLVEECICVDVRRTSWQISNIQRVSNGEHMWEKQPNHRNNQFDSTKEHRKKYELMDERLPFQLNATNFFSGFFRFFQVLFRQCVCVFFSFGFRQPNILFVC